MAQVYKRIANPFMPNGTPDKTNAPSPYINPGELGCSFNDQNTGKTYVRAQVDSGATAATPVGAILAGQFAYWKDETPGINLVTNDARFCDLGVTGAPFRIAGVFGLTPTNGAGVTGSDGNPQLYMVDLVIQGRGTPLQAHTTPTIGDIANPSLPGATGSVNDALVTAPSTSSNAINTPVVGVWSGNTAITAIGPNTYYADVTIGFVDN